MEQIGKYPGCISLLLVMDSILSRTLFVTDSILGEYSRMLHYGIPLFSGGPG